MTTAVLTYLYPNGFEAFFRISRGSEITAFPLHLLESRAALFGVPSTLGGPGHQLLVGSTCTSTTWMESQQPLIFFDPSPAFFMRITPAKP